MVFRSLSYFKPEVSQLQEYIYCPNDTDSPKWIPHSSFRGQGDQMEFPLHRSRAG